MAGLKAEIEQLKKQKREIERQIKQLENEGNVIVDGARLLAVKVRYPEKAPSESMTVEERWENKLIEDTEWKLAIKIKWRGYGYDGEYKPISRMKQREWSNVVVAKTREEALAEIPGIISELRKLYAEASKSQEQ